ncbi:unnamed protein product, partial [Pocillopora meandrina]
SDCCLPSDTGSCFALFNRFYYDKVTKRCKKFIYGGCAGNGNNFTSKKKCKKTCRNVQIFCCLPKFTGPCRAAFIRYYYDKVTKKCKMFTFGGCMNNGNNFKTLEECQKTCRETKCPPIE